MAEKQSKNIFYFSKKNLLIMLGGFLLTILGFILMGGGGSEDPNTFNADKLFSHRRITLAPFLVIIGYLIVMVGIMKKPKSK